MSHEEITDVSGVLAGTLVPRSEDPPFESLVELLDYRVTHAPFRQVAVVLEGDGESESLSHVELYEGARAVAMQLQRAGVKRGDYVLIVLPTSCDFLCTFFGTLLLGAATVPTAPPYSIQSVQLEAYGEAFEALIKDCKPKVCVTTPRLAGLLEAFVSRMGARLVLFSPKTKGPKLERDAIVHPSKADTALLQYTSGSTSQPKGVELTHGNLLANTAAIVHALTRREDDVILSWLPLYHDMGLIGAFLTTFRANLHVVLIRPHNFIKDPACWLKAISQHKATVTMAPNFAFGYCASRLTAADLPGVRLDSLRALLNGAEPIDVKSMEKFEQTFKPLGLKENVVRPVYGLAESALAVSFHRGGPFVSVRLDADRLERERRAVAVPAGSGLRAAMFVSVGRPIASQNVRIVNDRGRSVKDGEIGEVRVKGPSVMARYHNRPDDTKEVLKDGWLCTGDYGFLIDDHVFITGRKKDLIIRRGRNYYPQDIEFQVSKVHGVRKGSVAAFAVSWENDAELVVVAETKLEGSEKKALEPKIRERISQIFAFSPNEVLLVQPGTIPKTTSGKIRRNECRKRFLDGTLKDKPRGKWASTTRLAVSSGLSYLRQWVKGPREY